MDKKIIFGILLFFSFVMIGCSDVHDEDYSVDIEGKDMKFLTVKQVSDLWEIDAETLLEAIVEEFDFQGNYTVNTVLEDMREEYKFSPAIIKDLAEGIKQNQ